METYSSCCVQGLAGFWSSYQPPTDLEDSVSEVVYNWVAAGNKEGEAVYSQGTACSDCGPGYGCVEEGRIRASPICLLQGGCQKDQ